jgi:phage terminase Nu1 subunit (DNA packaging protein)
MRNGYDRAVLNDQPPGFDRPLPTGWGGAREGAGRPPGSGYTKSEDQKNLDHQKARHERVKADLAELAYREKVGELVTRAAVHKAAATSLATLAQALRTIPDTLERKYNLSPEVAEAIGTDIDHALDTVASMFELMAEPPTPPAEPDDDAS